MSSLSTRAALSAASRSETTVAKPEATTLLDQERSLALLDRNCQAVVGIRRLPLGREAFDQVVADELTDPVLDRCNLDRRHAAAAFLRATRAVQRFDIAGGETDEGESENEGRDRPAPEAAGEAGEQQIR